MLLERKRICKNILFYANLFFFSEESIPALSQVILLDVVEYVKIFDQLFIKETKVQDGAVLLEDWGKDIFNIYGNNLRVLFKVYFLCIFFFL